MNKLVSIVLPVYNGEKYLRESIDSVLSQTYQNWELIIVDDCSTDSTQSIVSEYVKKDDRIRYYRNGSNLKLPKNLNKGFSLTKGDYLTWTSDDNRFLPQAIEKMVKFLEKNTDIQFVYASNYIINNEGKIIESYSVPIETRKYIVGDNPVGACFMYTREVYQTIGDYNPELVLVEDFDYWQRICMKFGAIGLPDYLYEYRRHEGALTSTMKKEVFYQNLETTLKNNISGFGKLSLFQKHSYYNGLKKCYLGLKKSNPYKIKCAFLDCWYFVFVRIPSGIKRRLLKNIK